MTPGLFLAVPSFVDYNDLGKSLPRSESDV